MNSEPCLISMLLINFFVFPISLLINFHVLVGALMQFMSTTVYPVCSDDVPVRWGAWFAWRVVASPLSPYFNLQLLFQTNLG